MAVIGAALFICLHPIWIASGNTLDVSVEGVMVQIAVAELIIAGVSLLILFISPFIALFNHRLLAVVGTLYCLCEGYLISWTSVFLTPDMQWVPWCALALTILIAAVMLLLYMTGVARVGHRFRSFLMAVILTSIFGSLMVYVGTWIPGVRDILLPIVQDPLVGFIMSIAFVIIASLFLLSDFNMVQTTVEEGLPKDMSGLPLTACLFSDAALFEDTGSAFTSQFQKELITYKGTCPQTYCLRARPFIIPQRDSRRSLTPHGGQTRGVAQSLQG